VVISISFDMYVGENGIKQQVEVCQQAETYTAGKRSDDHFRSWPFLTEQSEAFMTYMLPISLSC